MVSETGWFSSAGRISLCSVCVVDFLKFLNKYCFHFKEKKKKKEQGLVSYCESGQKFI